MIINVESPLRDVYNKYLVRRTDMQTLKEMAEITANDVYNIVDESLEQERRYDLYYYNNFDREDSDPREWGEFQEEYELDCLERSRDLNTII